MDSQSQISILAMQGVSVSRGGRDILGPLDFKIQSGERWVILGPNGAGKSTLLNIHPLLLLVSGLFMIYFLSSPINTWVG